VHLRPCSLSSVRVLFFSSRPRITFAAVTARGPFWGQVTK